VAGTHRSGTARRRLLAVVLAAALGRGYAGRHRLAATALGHPVAVIAPVGSDASPSPAPASTSRQSVAPRLLVVRTASRHDLAVDSVLTSTILADVLLGDRTLADSKPVADTKPHPVVTLLPRPATSTDDAVYAAVDAERDEQVTAELADGQSRYLARHRPRHSA